MRFAVRLALVLLLIWPGTSDRTAFGLELDVSWRFPGLAPGGRANELVVRCVEPGSKPPGHAVTRLQLEEMASPAAVRLVLRPRDSYRRREVATNEYEATEALSLLPGEEVSIPLFVPSREFEPELVIETAGRRAWRKVLTNLKDESRGGDGPFLLRVSAAAEWSRHYRGLSSSGRVFHCAPESMPRSQAGLAPFEKIELAGVDVGLLEEQSYQALAGWIARRGILLANHETVARSASSPRWLRLCPSSALALPVGSSGLTGGSDALAVWYGLGRVVKQTRPPILASGFGRFSNPAPEFEPSAGRSQHEPKEWFPNGARLADRGGSYLLWLLPYGAALVVLGFTFKRLHPDRFMRLLPVVCLSFCLFYSVVAGIRPSETSRIRTELLFGTAHTAEMAALSHLAVFSPVAQRVELTDPGAGALAPVEAREFASRSYRERSEPLDAVRMSLMPGGWRLAFGLLPAQVRSFTRQLDPVATGAIEGRLAFDLEQRRWVGQVVSRLNFPLSETHIVHGWHHQRLQPLRPGDRLQVSMPLVGRAHAAGSGDDCRTGSAAHPSICPSCGRVHPLWGALRNVLARDSAEDEVMRDQLLEAVDRSPDFFKGPLLLGLAGASDSGTRRLIVVRLIEEVGRGGGLLPAEAATRDWDVGVSETGRAEKDYGCLGSDRWRYHCSLRTNQPMRFGFPIRGHLERLVIDAGELRGRTPGGGILVGLWNHESGGFQDHLYRAGTPLEITEGATRFLDQRDGSVLVKFTEGVEQFDSIDVRIEGSSR